MPHCQNRTGFIARQYVRVLAPGETKTVRVRPNGEDGLGNGATIREANSLPTAPPMSDAASVEPSSPSKPTTGAASS